MTLFSNPLLLIHKRKDKLLDYDSLQHDLERASEPDRILQLREKCELAKRNYEALNAQLLEELPLFCDRVTQAVAHLLLEFTRVQHRYHQAVAEVFSSGDATSNGVAGGENGESEMIAVPHLMGQHILSSLSSSLTTVSQHLSQLSIVPASLSTSFSVRQLNKIEESVPVKSYSQLQLVNQHTVTTHHHTNNIKVNGGQTLGKVETWLVWCCNGNNNYWNSLLKYRYIWKLIDNNMLHYGIERIIYSSGSG